MWHLRLLLFYLPAAIYVYLGLRGLFQRGRQRLIFSLFFLLLLLAFPLAEPLAHRSTGAAPEKFLILAGYLTLPYMLYLFLAVLGRDLLLVLNRLLHLAAGEATCRWRRVQLLLLLGLPLVVIWLGMVNHERLQLSSYRIAVPRRAAAPGRLRLVMAADFHLRDLTRRGLLARFVDRVNALRPDIILIPGDVLEGDRREERIKEWQAQLQRLRSTHGVYASPGNHEVHHGRDSLEFFRQAGIRLLQDEAVMIDRSCYVVGRKDSGIWKRKPMAELMARLRPDLPTVLLDHRPTDLQAAARAGVDILLSAHAHNGQLFPLNLITRLQYGLSWGYRKMGETHVFVTCGLQCWGPPVRTAGISEIMLIEVDLVK